MRSGCKVALPSTPGPETVGINQRMSGPQVSAILPQPQVLSHAVISVFLVLVVC